MYTDAEARLAKYVFKVAYQAAKTIASTKHELSVAGRSIEDLPAIVTLELVAAGQTVTPAYIARRVHLRWRDSARAGAREDQRHPIAGGGIELLEGDNGEAPIPSGDFGDLNPGQPDMMAADIVLERAEEWARDQARLISALGTIRRRSRNWKSFVLVDIRGMSYSVAAARSGIRVNTIKSHVLRARGVGRSVAPA